MTTIKRITELRQQLKTKRPLVHCITNHITINDCANAVLALGAKPIMAEHPDEVAEITAVAQSLAVNLGNISEQRMKSMLVSGKISKQKKIPCVIDVVGVGCSKLRLEYALKFIKECVPSVIKGNESEIRALCGLPHHAKGIDSEEKSSLENTVILAKTAAETFESVILISGKIDVVSNQTHTVFIKNGSSLMPYITGTGCILNVVCGAYLSVGTPLESAVSAAMTMGLAGEYAETMFHQSGSISQFHGSLMDALFSMSNEYYNDNGRIELYE